MFDIDKVELEFEPEAIRSVAHKAMELKTGARGLRTILEDGMLELMYEIPSRKDVAKVIIPKDYFTETDPKPILVTKEEEKKTEDVG